MAGPTIVPLRSRGQAFRRVVVLTGAGISVPSGLSCGAPLRPDIVLFNEPLGADAEVGAKRALRDCDLFVAIGTSGTVWPAANYVRSAEFEGAHTILVNLTAPEPVNPAFREVILGPAEVVVPALFA